NKYFRSEPSEEGILALGSYLTFWSFVYFAVTLWLIFAKNDEMDIKTVYQTIWNICKMPLLLTAKIGFIANEAVTALKLMEKGFSKEDLALAVLIDFPIQILVGYYAAKWSNGPQPLKPWINAFYGRIFFASVGMLVVYVFPENNKVSSSMFYVVIASIVLSSFTSTVQFVCISAFMSSIADPVIGGTYMTVSTWPRFFVLEAVDYFTDASCIIRTSTEEEEKSLCKEKGGVCTVHQDGYYIVSIICVLLGILSLTTFIIPTIKNLQSRKPITIPSEVEIKHDLTPNLQPITLTDLNSTTLTISGPLGSHSMPIKPFIKIEIIANEEKRKREILSARKKEVLESVKNQDVIFIDSDVSEKKLRVDIQSKSVEHQRAMWGTTRALIANYVIGVSEGFRIPIRLVGVGHRANMESDKLVLRVGYTHPIQLEVPDGIKCEVLNPTQILLIGSDYAQLTLFAANIRKNKKPEPYNQKEGGMENEPITLTDLNSTTLTISGPLGSHSMPIKPFIKIEIIANEEKRKREILSARKKEVLESVKNQDVIFIDSDVSEKKLRVDIQSKSVEHQRAMWGTTRALIANYVIGVSEGFRIPIRLVGVGHRANMESDKLVLRVGYTHPIQLEVPDGIKCEVLNPTQILLIGSDYAQLTLFAANIRKNKKPEPYNQKGIFVGDETIKKKTSKKK
ncbi:14330_t:CDS:10, partial [Entrophospora sp. SA101]